MSQIYLPPTTRHTLGPVHVLRTGGANDALEPSGMHCRFVMMAEPRLDADKQKRFVDAYRALSDKSLKAQEIEALPRDARFLSIDVTDRVQPSSFRHTTTLLVPYASGGRVNDPNEVATFYVAYGRSTNNPERYFGPFSLDATPI